MMPGSVAPLAAAARQPYDHWKQQKAPHSTPGDATNESADKAASSPQDSLEEPTSGRSDKVGDIDDVDLERTVDHRRCTERGAVGRACRRERQATEGSCRLFDSFEAETGKAHLGQQQAHLLDQFIFHC